MGEMKISYTILVGNPDRKNPLRRPRHSWDDNINMDLKKMVRRVELIQCLSVGSSGGLF
jgi:hypothetical protein